jgi:uncharacterized protein (TIRG00374 family)
MNKSRLFRIGRVVISAAIIAFLVYRLDRKDVAGYFRGIAVGPLVLAAVADFLMIFTNSLRWRVLLGAKGIRVPQARLLYYYLVGNFFSAFLPTAVGGDVVRVMGISGQTERRADIFASVLVERLLGFLVLLPIGLCAIPFLKETEVEWSQIAYVWIVVGALFVAVYIVLLRPVARWLSRLLDPLLRSLERFKARERLEHAYEAVTSYGCCRQALYKGFAISVVSRMLWITGCFMVARAFSMQLSFAALLLVVPIVELARMIPISASGIGVREATFVAMLAPFGIPESLGFAYGVVVYAIFMLFALIGGVLYGIKQLAGRS